MVVAFIGIKPLHCIRLCLFERDTDVSGTPSPGSQAYKEANNTVCRMTLHWDGNKYSSAALDEMLPMIIAEPGMYLSLLFINTHTCTHTQI